MPVTAGQYVKAWYTVTAATAGHTLRTAYYWYDADRTYISASAQTAPTVTSGVSYAPTVQAPAGAVLFSVVFTLYKGTTDVVDDSSSVSFNQVMASTASTSAALSGTFALVDPNPWSSSILGTTHEISIDRHVLDVGTMDVTIIDATLDPAVTGNLNRGDAVRLQGLVSGTWEDIFVGDIDDADVSYTRTDSGIVRTSIQMSAVDNIATLANRPSPYGYASFPYLAKTLNYSGIPFNANGNRSAQQTTATWTYSPDATMLDQVTRMRDSSLGYAWTDRHNVINGYDSLNLITNPSATADVSGWAATATLTRDGTYGVGPAGSFKLVTASGSGAATGYAYPNQGSGPSSHRPDTYLFEVWVFGTGSCYVQMYSNPAGTQFAISSTSPSRLLAEDHPHRHAPAGTTSIYPVIRQATAGAQTLYFDEANLTLVRLLLHRRRQRGATYEYYNGDIAVGWNRDEVINSVIVSFLRQTGDNFSVAAEEVQYGPYNDQPSWLRNGTRQKTFTTQGITDTDAAMKVYATSILAANKTPTRKASQLVMPVKNTRSFAHAATLDLYDLAGVKYSTLLDTRYRITSIHHAIETDKWLTTYGFGTVGAVADPGRAA
jgi:hypothetical protein